MDTTMAAQEHVALARSVLELFNSRQSDPAWLEKSIAAFAADAEDMDVPSGATLHGPDGHKRIALFFAESFPDLRVELTDVFATEDRVALESIVRGTNTGSWNLPTGAIPARGRSIELWVCHVFQIRNGKIASHHVYYDMLTQMEQLGLAPATGQAT
jgi:steroid delta-isomerase-like uncharacterized protein